MAKGQKRSNREPKKPKKDKKATKTEPSSGSPFKSQDAGVPPHRKGKNWPPPSRD